MTATETPTLAEQLAAALLASPDAAETVLVALRAGNGRLESLPLKANLHAELRGPDGELKEIRELKNLVVTAGKTALTQITGTKYIKDFAYLAIGSGSVAAAAGNTALGTELARGLGTVTAPTTTSVKVAFTFAAGTGTGTIAEYGLLDAATLGNLLNRIIDASPVVKGAGDSLQADVTISL